MRGIITFIFILIFVAAFLLLMVWQFGILKKSRTSEPAKVEIEAKAVLDFAKNFDFAADFQKLKTLLPAGVVREIAPLATEGLGVTDPFGLSPIYSTSTSR